MTKTKITFLLLLLFSSCTVTDSQQDTTTRDNTTLDPLVSTKDCWSAGGATGIVDENASKIALGENLFGLPSSVDQTTIKRGAGLAYLTGKKEKGVYHIRYAVTHDYRTSNNKYVSLFARYKVEDKSLERVVVNYNRYLIDGLPNENTEENIETLITIDSDNHHVSSDFQNQFSEEIIYVPNYQKFAYFIDVQLINKVDRLQLPVDGIGTAIAAIRLCSDRAIIK